MNPRSVGEWLARLPGQLTVTAFYDLLLWALAAAVVALVVRYARRWVDREIEEVNKRHRVRKAVGYAGTFLVLAFGLVLLLGQHADLTVLLGILAAGAAIALQDVAKSAIGWVYLTGRAGMGSGARVEVEGFEGEIIDVGFLKTTLLEVGNRVRGRQSSARLVTVPNSRFLNQVVHVFPDFSPYTWQEQSFLLTYESDWRRAADVLEEIGREAYEGAAGGASAAFSQLERRFAFKHGPLTPIVYLTVAESGVQLTLRYLSHIRRARGVADRVSRKMLAAVESEPRLDFAYPTWRVYRRGEAGPGGEGTPAGER